MQDLLSDSYYGAFTKDANHSIHRARHTVTKKLLSLTVAEAHRGNEIAHKALGKVGERYGEAHDTACREAFIGRIERDLEEAGADPDRFNLSIYS